MRVALLTYSTKPRGGVVHTLALAEALAALGVSVTVWTLGRDGDGGFFRPVGVPVRVVPFVPLDGESVGERILRSIAVLREAFDPSDYDVVHAQDCISANAVRGVPYVRTVHHLDQFTTPELAACHERAIMEPFAHVCVSAAVAAEVRAGWGLSPTVIPNGVDAARFAAARPATHLGRYVLAVGGIEPRKGSIELLEAFAELRRPDVELVIAGGETLFDYREYRARWEARAAALGVEPLVLGPVPHEELPSLVAGAAAFAFPSTKEGFGLAAMEALAAGVSVVTSDLPVLREVFGSAVRFAGSVDALAGALAEALDHPHDPAPGRALAQSYTWTTAARAHLDFYRAKVASVSGLVE
ncbi:MSMEG_0565 family glycosyltransferase [Cryptosporangium phraense]|uniref:MSMEG_0565 family glycosyltransferase n=1 Tax=Cryptosporangium phraense TaxID=2593070 RepID=A0A545AJQ7_9ACTN|nr:MSMEG_0565 family glycosyltransferase [Cryptosporangium phraense]TQS41529.1 MSMEG_0565 family glycosyltransferase [Cryptosporangium phraense]